jgi:hypothetical protein
LQGRSRQTRLIGLPETPCSSPRFCANLHGKRQKQKGETMTAQTAAKQAAAPQTPPLPQAKPESLGLSSIRLQRMSDAFKRDIDKGTIPGVTVMVARRGQIGWFEALGRQNPAALCRWRTIPSSASFQ